MKATMILLLVIAALGASIGVAQEKGEQTESKVKGRLEQLYLWKVSDRLNLNAEQEARFKTIYKEITDNRARLSGEMDKCLGQIEKSKGNAAEVQKHVTKYEDLLKQYNGVSTEEFDRMKRFLGTAKFGEYLLLKREMTQKLKDVISTGGLNLQTKAARSPLKDPEVIQE
jgi:flagellar motility protein MotE (MotC chaperone)